MKTQVTFFGFGLGVCALAVVLLGMQDENFSPPHAAEVRLDADVVETQPPMGLLYRAVPFSGLVYRHDVTEMPNAAHGRLSADHAIQFVVPPLRLLPR